MRRVVDLVENSICIAFDTFGKMSWQRAIVKLPDIAKSLDDLGRYDILRALIPDIPSSCHDTLVNVSKTLSLEESLELSDALDILCSLPPSANTCLAQLGTSMQAVHWIADQVPSVEYIFAGIVDLLPTTCMLLGEGKSGFDRDTLLTSLPKFIFLYGNLTSSRTSFLSSIVPFMTPACIGEMHHIATRISLEPTLASASAAFCSPEFSSTASPCFEDLSDRIDNLEMYKDLIPQGLVKSLVRLVPESCNIIAQLGEFRHDQIISSIPLAFQLLQNLSSVPTFAPYVPSLSSDCNSRFANKIFSVPLSGSAINDIVQISCDMDQFDRECIRSFLKDLAATASELLGAEDLSTLVDAAVDALPEICPLARSALQNATAGLFTDQSLSALNATLQLVSEIRSFDSFSGYVPHISENCSKAFLSGFQVMDGFNLQAGCNALLQPGVLECATTLGSELDSIPIVKSALKSAIGANGVFIRDTMEFASTIIPGVCTIVPSAFDSNGRLLFDVIFASIPKLISIYKDAWNAAPPALQTMLPAFPQLMYAATRRLQR